MSNKTNNLKAYLRDLYEGIVSKKPDASRNPQNFRSEIEAIRTGGELYEVMDASELPEDAPTGSLALVEGEPIPEAYTVSSVDELPSNAVDGSMAIVGNDDIVGTWRFGYTLKTVIDHCYSQQEYEENIDNYFRPFNAKYTNEYGEEIFITNFSCVEYHNADDSTEYYNGIQISEFNDAWIYDENRWGYNYESLQITILETPDEQVEQWVRENANKVYSLYTHENGQWVYKCEVV